MSSHGTSARPTRLRVQIKASRPRRSSGMPTGTDARRHHGRPSAELSPHLARGCRSSLPERRAAESRRQLIATESLLRDSRYDFLFRPGQWCPRPTFNDLDAQPEEDLDGCSSQWIGGDTPVAILDLSGVPVSILTDLVGVFCGSCSTRCFGPDIFPEGGRSRPLLVVLEEAHAYLSACK